LEENIAVIKIPNPKRALVYRFLELGFVTRSLILSKLKLIDEKDEAVLHVDLMDKIILKATQNKTLNIFWDLINEKHGDNKYKDIDNS